MGASRNDKSAIHMDYISSDISLRALAKKHKVADSTVRRWAKEDGWIKEKQEFLASAAYQAKKNVDARKAQLFGELTDRWERMYSTADALLEKVDASGAGGYGFGTEGFEIHIFCAGGHHDSAQRRRTQR